jgi:O-methyltransferase
MPTSICSTRTAGSTGSFKQQVRDRVPLPLLVFYRFFRTSNGRSVLSFLLESSLFTFAARLKLISGIYRVSSHVRCEHSETEILTFVRALLFIPPDTRGCIVETGCFKGGSTAKFSLAAAIKNLELIVFDSFEGLPDNSEPHEKNIWGGRVRFLKGDYCGALKEVTSNVRRYGDPSVCRFVKGFFDDTLPHFCQPVIAAYLDVDLASSTRTCLKHLWPLLVPGGILFSQDGHLPLVLKVFDDDDFWKRELKTSKPRIHGFGTSQLIWCRKESNQCSPPGR